MSKVARAASVELTEQQKRSAVAHAIGKIDLLGKEVTGNVPFPPSNISPSRWNENADLFRFIVLEDGRIFHDRTPHDLSNLWWETELKLGFRKEHHGGSFGIADVCAICDNSLEDGKVKYLACYWLGPEGVKVAITDRFTNNVEYAGFTVEQGVAVMNMLHSMVA